MPAPPGQPLRVFISCVSAHFKACRDTLPIDLRTMSRRHTFLLLVVAFVSGCRDGSRTPSLSSPPSPPKTELEAGIIVTNLAFQGGVRLQDYEEPSVKFDAARRVWWYYYQRKPGMPGGHFTVTVDETGKTQLFPGA